MKHIVTCFFISIILIISCNTGTNNSLISQENLVAEKFTININRDTVLQTENGALLKIPAGSLETKNGNSITLEIKEAYSMQQIIKAGLFTQSNGQPLSSGGMIYINAANGQDVKFNKKINVAIPTDYLEKNMQLYKGEEKQDGIINWVKPDTLPQNRQLNSIENGKILFESKCASCHSIGEDLVGPNLAHFMKRFPPEEVSDEYYYHRMSMYFNKKNSIDTSQNSHYNYMHAVDIYKCNVHLMWGSLGVSFPDLENNSAYLDVFKYIQNESDRLKLPLPDHAYLKECTDSCEAYNQKVYKLLELRNLSETERNKLIADNGEITVVIPDSVMNAGFRATSFSDFDEKVSPENFDANYYQFTVDSFGWYNIDMLINGKEGVEESELFVKVVGDYTERVNIFLIIPSRKVYGEGGPAVDKDGRYAFFMKNGKIPLPQGEKAFILAVSEQNGNMAFAIKEFTIAKKQEFELSLKTSTKEVFENAVKGFDANRLHIKVEKSKNADEIRTNDIQLKNLETQLQDAEKLKPKGCDCDCGLPEKYPVSSADSLSDETSIR